MRKVRRIEIATNRLVDQGVAGDYHSVFKGRGMEFAEVRPYQPGDDVRTHRLERHRPHGHAVRQDSSSRNAT